MDRVMVANTSMRRYCTAMVSTLLLLSGALMMCEVPHEVVSGQNGEVEVTFTNVSAAVGLSGVTGNFFSWGDFDNDGYEDLLIDGKKLFRNSGPPGYTFFDVTQKAKIGKQVNSGVFGDYDNDGWLDIFCGGGRGSNDHPQYPDILWHNERDGTFSDKTASAGGISDTFPTVAGAWADVDRDGSIDLFMANYENGSLQGYGNHFWRNKGDGTFENGTVEYGFDEGKDPLQSRGASWSDADNDGWLDLYVSNYRIMPNYLYVNDGTGRFTESAEKRGVNGHGNPHPVTGGEVYYGHSLGSSWGDLDNDGDMDLWVTNLAHKDAWRGPICDDSYLFENLGEEGGWSFTDRRADSGIPVKEMPGTIKDGDELMVSSGLADYDNDGDLDLFVPQIYSDVSYSYSYLYRNDGDFRFTEVGPEAGLRVWNTYGSAWCDYDQDGWIDLVTGGGTWDADRGGTTNSNVHLFRNNGGKEAGGKGWMEVQLEGRESNRMAIGARVTVDVDRDGDGTMDHKVIREVQGGTAAHGQQDSMVLHFGLGGPVASTLVTVNWPLGRRTLHRDLDPGTVHRLFEPTEDIEVNITLLSAEMDEDGILLLDHRLENPSSYPLGDRLLEVTVNDGRIRHEEWDRSEVLPGGTASGRIDLDTGDISSIGSISIRIARSYPNVLSTGDRLEGEDLKNSPPIAVLEVPERSTVGESVILSGKGSYDPDGSVTGYLFDAGDGTKYGWMEGPEIEHAYSHTGTYTVVLSVKDDDGDISFREARSAIMVEGEPVPEPIARILSIEPREADEGEEVTFSGEGTPSSKEVITDHEWRSSLDGLLSGSAVFSTDSLSEGYHEITYRVRDSGGTWSRPDGSWSRISIPESIWVSIDDLPTDGPLSGEVMFSGSSGPEDEIVAVEVRVDSDPWSLARTSPDWTFKVDCDLLNEGQHVILARSTDGMKYSPIRQMNFSVEDPKEVRYYVYEGEDDGTVGLFIIIMICLMSVAGAIFLSIFLRSGRNRSRDLF